MTDKYYAIISKAIKTFWLTKKRQGNVLAGKQLDGFLELLTIVAIDAGIPKECIYLRNNHIPGFYRATKDWDLLIVSPQGNLATSGADTYENLSNRISIESFINSFCGHLLGMQDEFNK